MKNIAVVAGTRPEVIKMAPVFLALKNRARIRPVFLSSGQHREMLAQACRVFKIVPDYDLDVMRAGQDLTDLTGRLLLSAGQWLRDHRPDAILVQGDTTTVLALALAAFYARIPVGHVESGLRTYNLEAPWPEEMNRRLTAPICRWCFAPTPLSRQNLLAERIPSERIFVTGNTVIDAVLYVRDAALKRTDGSEFGRSLGLDQAFVSQYLGEVAPGTGVRKPFLLVTGHRRESFGDRFEGICRAILALVQRNENLGVVYPVHLNPNVQRPVRSILGGNSRIQLIEPVSYEAFVWLMIQARLILTDSGGVQEEAPSLGKPVLVMRENTERPEGVDAGSCEVVGTSHDSIVTRTEALLRDQREYARRSALSNPYGDGKASERIADIVSGYFEVGKCDVVTQERHD